MDGDGDGLQTVPELGFGSPSLEIREFGASSLTVFKKPVAFYSPFHYFSSIIYFPVSSLIQCNPFREVLLSGIINHHGNPTA